jgi:hypothetical protein
MSDAEQRADLRDRDRHHSWREVYDELEIREVGHE